MCCICKQFVSFEHIEFNKGGYIHCYNIEYDKYVEDVADAAIYSSILLRDLTVLSTSRNERSDVYIGIKALFRVQYGVYTRPSDDGLWRFDVHT